MSLKAVVGKGSWHARIRYRVPWTEGAEATERYGTVVVVKRRA